MSQSVFHQSPPLTHILKRKREIEERKLRQTFMEGKKEKNQNPSQNTVIFHIDESSAIS